MSAVPVKFHAHRFFLVSGITRWRVNDVSPSFSLRGKQRPWLVIQTTFKPFPAFEETGTIILCASTSTCVTFRDSLGFQVFVWLLRIRKLRFINLRNASHQPTEIYHVRQVRAITIFIFIFYFFFGLGFSSRDSYP